MTVLDIGFGTGFPLIELGQRFGKASRVYGVDIWEEAIVRVREKIKILGLANIEILEEDAADISLDDGQLDLVTSNLGVNNFEEKEKVYAEIHRVLKPGGRLCITTNPTGTFGRLFEIFRSVMNELNLKEETEKLEASIRHRNSEQGIISEILPYGFGLVKSSQDTTNFRFADAEALMDHSLIRIGFREYWEQMIRPDSRQIFFERVLHEIDRAIDSEGEFSLTVPMIYLEFEKGKVNV